MNKSKEEASKGNKGGGRSTAYKPAYARMDNQEALFGATDKNFADVFRGSERTINAWKKNEVEFSSVLKKGKTIADAKVLGRLSERGTGYSHPEEKIFCHEGNVGRAETTKHYPPEIFWLKNRQRFSWTDRVDEEKSFTGEVRSKWSMSSMFKVIWVEG